MSTFRNRGHNGERGIMRLSNFIRSSNKSVGSAIPGKHDEDSIFSVEESNYSVHSLPVKSITVRPGKTRKEMKWKRLTWNTIEIREYERICGDNPSCSIGVPIGIGWQHAEPIVVQLTEFEESRPPRRSHREMLMSWDERRNILLDEWDVTQREIAAAVREAQKIKHRRRQTIMTGNETGMNYKMEEFAERFKRKTKKVLLFRPSVTEQAVALAKASTKAQEQRSLIAALTSESENSFYPAESTKQDLDAESTTALSISGSGAGVTTTRGDASHCASFHGEEGSSCISPVGSSEEETSENFTTSSGKASNIDPTEQSPVFADDLPVHGDAHFEPSGDAENSAKSEMDEKKVRNVEEVKKSSVNKATCSSIVSTETRNEFHPFETPAATRGSEKGGVDRMDLTVVDNSTYVNSGIPDMEDSDAAEVEEPQVCLSSQAKTRRKSLVQEANQRYQEQKKIDDRIKQLKAKKRAVERVRAGLRHLGCPSKSDASDFTTGRSSPAQVEKDDVNKD